MPQKKSEKLALELKKNLLKRKKQKNSIGSKTSQLRNIKIGISSLLDK